MFRRILSLAAVSLFAFGVTACGPDFQRIDISAVNPSPGEVKGQVNYQKVVVAEGMIITARIEPFNDNGKSMYGNVRSLDPSTMEVSTAINDRVFAFIGQRVGKTQLEFYASDKVVLVVDAEVVEQPPPQP